MPLLDDAQNRRPSPARTFASVRFVREDGSAYNPHDPQRDPPPPSGLAGRDGDAHQTVYAFSASYGDGEKPVVGRRSPGRGGGGDSFVFGRRAKSPLHQRDSLASRTSPHRAGSRRRQRWERERDILRGQALTEEEVKALFQVDSHSMFTELFEDGALMAKWATFCREGEDRQEEIIKPPARQAPGPRMTSDPHELYGRISSRARGMLERGVGIDFLRNFEAELVRAVFGDGGGAVPGDGAGGGGEQGWELTSEAGGEGGGGKARVTLRESLSRMVCHQTCVFYSLSSFSVPSRGGGADPAKTLMIHWQPNPTRPLCSLSDYLARGATAVSA